MGGAREWRECSRPLCARCSCQLTTGFFASLTSCISNRLLSRIRSSRAVLRSNERPVDLPRERATQPCSSSSSRRRRARSMCRRRLLRLRPPRQTIMHTAHTRSSTNPYHNCCTSKVNTQALQLMAEQRSATPRASRPRAACAARSLPCRTVCVGQARRSVW